jgi:hypothetical protein
MYTQFEKAVKQYEELVDRVKEVNEFWLQSTLSTMKEFFKIAKNK